MVRKFLQEVYRRKLDLIHSAQIVHSLYEQQKEGKFCDLKVIVEDQKYFVHRCVLAASSVELGAHIAGLSAIRLVGVTCYGFERLLEILYCGTLSDICTIQKQKFKEIVTAADALHSKFVLEFCARERSDLLTDFTKQPPSKPVGSENPAIASTSKSSAVEMKSSEGLAGEKDENEFEVLPEMCDWGDLPDLSEIDFIAADVEIPEVGLDTDALPQNVEEEMLKNTSPHQVARIESSGRHIHPDTEKGIKCTICQQRFTSLSVLKAHMRKHSLTDSGRKTFQCPRCSMVFNFEESLQSHLKLHEMRKWVCKTCGKGFKLRKNLRQHNRKVHPKQSTKNPVTSPPKPDADFVKSLVEGVQAVDGKFSCPVCDKSFARRWSLKCHMLTHSGVTTPGDDCLTPKYECGECGSCFDRLSGVRKHATQVHRGVHVVPRVVDAHGNSGLKFGETEDLTCWCKICGKGFKRARNLKSHMDMHKGSGYDCPICGRRFAQRDGLNGHLWIHGGYADTKGEGNIKEQSVEKNKEDIEEVKGEGGC